MSSSDRAEDRVGAQWPGVGLRHLAAIDAIAHEGSFRGAAVRLGYVQSAMSQQIAHVEKSVGMRLIERRHGQRSVSLTPAGAVLLEHSRAILAELAAARADLATLGEERPRGFRLALAPSVARSLAPLVEAAHTDAPDEPALECVEPTREPELVQLVERGLLDAAVGELAEVERLSSSTLLDDPYVVVLPAGSDLAAHRTAVTLDELHELTLVAPLEPQGFAHGERFLAALGVRAEPIARRSGASTLQALVSDLRSAAVLPRMAVDTSDESIVTLPLEGMPPRPVGVFWQAQRRRIGALDEVLDALRRAVQRLPRAVPEQPRLRLTS